MALSRVPFEFKSTLRHVRSMKVESNHCLVQVISRQSTSILNAVNPLLTARNREVVKAVLGFVTLCVQSSRGGCPAQTGGYSSEDDWVLDNTPRAQVA